MHLLMYEDTKITENCPPVFTTPEVQTVSITGSVAGNNPCPKIQS
jgi:hypothetical protein